VATIEAEIVDRLLEQLLSVKEARPGTEVNLAEEDIFWLCLQCRKVMERRRKWGREGFTGRQTPEGSLF